jgi:hypothetical protein
MCPVLAYKEYARRRPVAASTPTSRFYLQPLRKPSGDVWFSTQPLGKNAISSLAKRMSEAAGLEKKTNHSGRKTAVQTLLRAEVPPTSVMQLTGHKNVQSLNSYSSLSVLQQQQMSKTLSSLLPIQPKPVSAVSTSTIEQEADVAYDMFAGFDESWDSLGDAGGAASDNGSHSLASVNTPAAAIGTVSNMVFDIPRLVPMQLQNATNPPVFKFLNGVINGNVTINFGLPPPQGQ